MKLRAALNQAEMRTLEAACRDEEAGCPQWAAADECTKNAGFMLVKCKRSCLDKGVQAACPGVVSEVPKCQDAEEACQYWADNGQCKSNPDFMLKQCQLSCKVCGSDGSHQDRPN